MAYINGNTQRLSPARHSLIYAPAEQSFVADTHNYPPAGKQF